MLKKWYSITEAADVLNLRTHTLRYWEEELDLEIPRNEMGHRIYYQEQMDLFERVRRLKDEGYQLTAIRMQLQSGISQPEEALKGAGIESKSVHSVLPVGEKEKKAIKLEQFQRLMSEIVKDAMEENNHIICTQVEERILKEMNYLMREQEEQERQRYMQIDRSLRQLMEKGVMKAEKKPLFGRKKEAVTKCSPLTNTL